MKRSPIVRSSPYETSRIGTHTVFLLNLGQGLPRPQWSSVGDYCVTYDGDVFVRLDTGFWMAVPEDSPEREMALSAWRLKNEPPPTHLQF